MDIIEYSNNLINKSSIFADLMQQCKYLLKTHPLAMGAKSYLKDRLPKDVAGFNFGYFPDDYNLSLLEMEQSKLRHLGIIYDRYYYEGEFPQKVTCSIFSDHNLIMPYKNLYGDILGLVGRTLRTDYKQAGISKYKNSPLPKGLSLFGLYNAKDEILEKDSVIIVEGQFDCITCHRFGVKNVVALGSASLTKYQMFLLLRYTNNIKLLLDSDDAGKKAADKIIKLNEIYGNPMNISKCCVPDIYKDIDEFFLKDKKLAKEFINAI
jgi:DNA primase